MTAEEYLKANEPESVEALGEDNFKFICSIMEAYLKHEVNSITEEDKCNAICDELNINGLDLDEKCNIDYGYLIQHFKNAFNKLLKQ